jgi:hypothetical protein
VLDPTAYRRLTETRLPADYFPAYRHGEFA